MKKIILVLIGIFFLLFNLNAKEEKYPVVSIPQELIKNADVVIRSSKKHFTILSVEKGKLEVSEVITIMNKSGIDYSIFEEYYSSFRKIRNIKGVYYDEYGEEIKKIKKDDLIDVPAISGFSLFDDSRVIYFNPEIEKFPFTFEYSYTVEFDGLLSYPSWYIYSSNNESLQYKEYKVTIPKDNNFEIRKYYQNLELEPQKTSDANNTTYTWSVSNYPIIEYEPYNPGFSRTTPALFLAPNDFRIDGFDGNMESWENFGNWKYQLIANKNNLSDVTKTKIKGLVADAKDETEKVKVLYKYMQDKNRYVNISVGIGGWEPFDAETVDRLSYGDCKALSNYMKSILECIGIQSYYTVIKAGAYKSPIISEFPMNQFNHVILCVPIEGDTIWLECTNNKIPAGYLGDFIDDRDAFIIKEDASELVHTKEYSIEENMQKRHVSFELNETGSGVAEVKTTYIGLGTENVYGLIDAPREDIKRYLYRTLEIPDFSIDNFEYSVDEKRIPEITENINIQVKNYSSIMGNRLLVPINLMNKIDRVPKRVKDRKTNIKIRRSDCEIDNIEYIIPTGYSVENVPQNVTINSKFGEYKTEVNQTENEINYKRTFSMFKGEYSPNDYEEFRKFFLQISKADKAKFVLVKL